MSTGTGTRAAAPYAVTAGELLDEVRAALGDTAGATWSDAELLGFVGGAGRGELAHPSGGGGGGGGGRGGGGGPGR